YMAAPSSSREADCEFWRQVMKHIILPSDVLAETLENQSVFWNDDLGIMSTFVLKTIKQFGSAADGETVKLLPMFKDDEDRRFGPELFMHVVNNRDLYREYIDRFINRDQWESERIALMDIVVLMTAIAEMLHFPSIPLAVTINEYIEIAKGYSSPKSGQFVNGMLYSLSNYLREQGQLHKS
ncbi:MAG: transcription antitermination protein NusB, partial [Muribaculaceae bacterium]|nr:transcription antitermination protein NusB [Muribaculaceae bacterium]